MTWAAVRVRFRLGNMNKQGWLWAFGLLIFMFITVGMLGFTARGLADLPILAPPSHWPAELNPAVPPPTDGPIPSVLMGQTLLGN